MLQASGRVEARPNAEADRLGIDLTAVAVRYRQQRSQAGALGAPDGAQGVELDRGLAAAVGRGCLLQTRPFALQPPVFSDALSAKSFRHNIIPAAYTLDKRYAASFVSTP